MTNGRSHGFFEYFYGFLGGDSSQWQPNLYRNTTAIYPYIGHPGWNLITAMADDAIDWMTQLNEIDPSMPFLVYYALGASHAPHHPTPEWIKKISDMHLFDTRCATRSNADAPSHHRTQYFEMMGVQGLYKDGWMLSAIPTRAPWDLLGKVTEDPASAYNFELYDLRHDWTQKTDVAAAKIARARETRDLMFGEFAKYNVLPLDASMATRVAAPRPGLAAGRRVFAYSGKPVTGIPDNAAPNVLNTSHTISANIDVSQGGAEGSIVSEGGRFGGYGLYLLKGKPVFTWKVMGLNRVRWEGPEALLPGNHTMAFDFKYDGLGFATLAFNDVSGLGRSGTGTLTIDGKVVSTHKMEHTTPILLPIDETFDFGRKPAHQSMTGSIPGRRGPRRRPAEWLLAWRHFGQLVGELEHACVRRRSLDVATGEIAVKPDPEQVQPLLLAEIRRAFCTCRSSVWRSPNRMCGFDPRTASIRLIGGCRIGSRRAQCLARFARLLQWHNLRAFG